MIAVDASSFRRHSVGERGDDVTAVENALQNEELFFPPPVVTELLSDPRPDEQIVDVIIHIPQLELSDGFWARAGSLRATLLRAGVKARLADTLIAQCCIDHDVPLITCDREFRRFIKAGLKLL
jgi:predicted nucleic acid-binding protein